MDKVRRFDLGKDLDKVMDIWLKENILSHNFIDESYWISNFDFVKASIPKSDVYIYPDKFNNPLGFIGVIDGYIAGIFVKNNYQNMGIGSKLLNYIKLRYSFLSLHVYEKNIKALNFYISNDFKKKSCKSDKFNNLEIYMEWNK